MARERPVRVREPARKAPGRTGAAEGGLSPQYTRRGIQSWRAPFTASRARRRGRSSRSRRWPLCEWRPRAPRTAVPTLVAVCVQCTHRHVRDACRRPRVSASRAVETRRPSAPAPRRAALFRAPRVPPRRRLSHVPSHPMATPRIPLEPRAPFLLQPVLPVRRANAAQPVQHVRQLHPLSSGHHGRHPAQRQHHLVPAVRALPPAPQALGEGPRVHVLGTRPLPIHCGCIHALLMESLSKLHRSDGIAAWPLAH